MSKSPGVRAFHRSKTGRGLGVAALLAMCSTHINKNLRGVGGRWWDQPERLNRPVAKRHRVCETCGGKGASGVLVPISSRKQLFDLSEDVATKITVVFYQDAREAPLKAIAD